METPLQTAIKNATKSYYNQRQNRIAKANEITLDFLESQGIDRKPGKVTPYRVFDSKTLRTALATVQNDQTKEYQVLQSSEEDYRMGLETFLSKHPLHEVLFNELSFLPTGPKGIISGWIQIDKAEFPSSIWKYFGLDQAKKSAGKGTHNEYFKTKLISELGPALIKEESPWSLTYRNYRARVDREIQEGKRPKTNPSHIHVMAIRYTVKQFLVEVHRRWRIQEGLPTSQPFQPNRVGS